jgi:hypothetical protein
MRSALRILAITVLCLAAGVAASLAEEAGTQTFNGRVEIYPQPKLLQTLVIVRFADATQRPLAFVAQHPGTASTEVWKGTGTVIVADTALAVVKKDGSGFLFRFTGRTLPSTLAKMVLTTVDSIGIASYGREPGSVLSQDYVKALKETGSCERIYQGVDSLITPMAKEICLNCAGGGAGSSSCSITCVQCSVTCQDGNYSCCNCGTCRCCKE